MTIGFASLSIAGCAITRRSVTVAQLPTAFALQPACPTQGVFDGHLGYFINIATANRYRQCFWLQPFAVASGAGALTHKFV